LIEKQEVSSMVNTYITGLCLGAAGMINICRKEWANRITGALLVAAGVNELNARGCGFAFLIWGSIIPITIWILLSSGVKKSSKSDNVAN
jgi:uncharacterized membrane protein